MSSSAKEKALADLEWAMDETEEERRVPREDAASILLQ